MPPDQVIVVRPQQQTVRVSTQGIRGPKGDPGPAGGFYVHDQAVASDTWVIVHNLGRHPAIVVTDSAGTQVYGTVVHDSINQATVTFSTAFGGRADAS